MKRQRLTQYTWDEFSRRLAKRQQLPLGTRLVLYTVNGRRKRSDWQVKIKRLRFKEMASASNRATVSDLLDMARVCLSTDISAKRLKLRLECPKGHAVNGNKLVGTVRAMPRQLTDDDHQAAEQRSWEIGELQGVADSELHQAEHLIDDSADVVVHAYIFALTDRYGRQAVSAALEDTRHQLRRLFP